MKEEKESKKFCAHCNSQINSNYVKEPDSGLLFCCEGCRSVYHIIQDEGFASFYNKRINWQPGPVEKIDISPEYFENSLKTYENNKKELTIIITGIRCAACIWLIEHSLSKEQGIITVRMNYATHKAKIQFNGNEIDSEQILNKIASLGYCPLPYTAEDTVFDKERKDLFYRFGTAAFFSMQLMIYSAALYAGYFQGIDEGIKFLFRLLSWVLATPVILFSGLPFFRNSLISLKNRHFTMDTLVAIGSGSAYLYSIAAIFIGYETYFDTSAMIITLILLGRFIEAGAKQKSGNAVKKLQSLKPSKVKIVKNTGEKVIIPISHLCKDDYFEIENGSAVAADGIIDSGSIEIDESMITGESKPIHKKKGDEVFAGSVCITGIAKVRTTVIGNDTFIARIAAAVENAQESKAPIQNISDKFVGKFVPFVIIISLCTFMSCFFIFEHNISDSLMRAVSVLIIACPCAMGLATPLAIITASSRLSEIGIIFKNGEAIERCALVSDFYFDKTGTLTEGRMSVENKIIKDNRKDFLNLITSAARMSKHPASKAISSLSATYIGADDYKDFPSKGIEAKIGNNYIRIGSLQFIKEKNPELYDDNNYIINGEKWRNEKGETIVYALINNEITGVFGIADTLRPEAEEVVETLMKMGIKISILTGDSMKSALHILQNFSVKDKLPIYAGISPFDKSEIIKTKSSNLSKTAMVGDGINDAIALTSAGIGISMREGTDISIESASAIMLRSDLKLIARACQICRKSLRIIKENLFWAFSYNVAAIPLAVTGIIHPIISAICMSISSLFVVLNSLRIKKF